MLSGDRAEGGVPLEELCKRRELLEEELAMLEKQPVSTGAHFLTETYCVICSNKCTIDMIGYIVSQ